MTSCIQVSLVLLCCVVTGYRLDEALSCGFYEVLFDTHMCYHNLRVTWESTDVTGTMLHDIITGYCASITGPGVHCFVGKIIMCANWREILDAFDEKRHICDVAEHSIKPYLSTRLDKTLLTPGCLTKLFLRWTQCRDGLTGGQTGQLTIDPPMQTFNESVHMMHRFMDRFVNCTMRDDFMKAILAEKACSEVEPRDAILTMSMYVTFNENLAFTLPEDLIQQVVMMDSVRHQLQLSDVFRRELEH